MYKKRFAAWKISKNLRMDEVVQILGLKRERDAAQKRSVYLIRGRRIDSRSLQTYLSRNPAALARLGAATVQGRTELGVACRTPSPPPPPPSTPTPADLAVGLGGLKTLAADHVPRPSATLMISKFEHLLHTLQCYLDESFGTKLWSWNQEKCWNTRRRGTTELLLNKASSRCLTASLGVSNGTDVSLIREALDICFENMVDILKDPPPTLIPAILRLSGFLLSIGRYDILSMVLRFTRDFSTAAFGPNNTFSALWQSYVELCDSNASDVIQHIFEFCFDAYQNRLGVSNRTTLLLLRYTLEASGESSEAKQTRICREISRIDTSVANLKMLQSLYYQHAMQTCCWHLEHERLAEAEDALMASPHERAHPEARFEWYTWVGFVRMRRGNLVGAETMFREGVRAAEMHGNLDDVLRVMYAWETSLQWMNNYTGAAEVRRERLRRSLGLNIIN